MINSLVTIKEPKKAAESDSDWVYMALHPVSGDDTRQEVGRCKPGEMGVIVKSRQTNDGKNWHHVLLSTGLSGWLSEDEVNIS